MKFKDGITGKEINTEAMTDLAAELVEAMAKMTEIFIKYKVPMMMVFADPYKKDKACLAFNFNESVKDMERIMGAINGSFVSCKLPYQVNRKREEAESEEE